MQPFRSLPGVDVFVFVARSSPENAFFPTYLLQPRHWKLWCTSDFSPRMWRKARCLHRILLLTCGNVACKLISVLERLWAGEQVILTSATLSRQSSQGPVLRELHLELVSFLSLCHCLEESLARCRHLAIVWMDAWKCSKPAFSRVRFIQRWYYEVFGK